MTDYQLFADSDRCQAMINLDGLQLRCGRHLGHEAQATATAASFSWHGLNIEYADAEGVTHVALLEWPLTTINALPPETIPGQMKR